MGVFRRGIARTIRATRRPTEPSDRICHHPSHQAIHASYCPAAGHRLLAVLQHRRHEVDDWLVMNFVREFGPENGRLNLHGDSLTKSLIGLQRIFTAKWRLFELHFQVHLTWRGYHGLESHASFIPFPYDRQLLAEYYSKISSHKEGPGDDATSLERLSFRNMLGVWLPSHVDPSCMIPDQTNLSPVQMAAWSLAVSIGTVIVIGVAVSGNNSLVAWGWRILDSWEPRLIHALMCEEDDSGTCCADRPPPPYTSEDTYPRSAV